MILVSSETVWRCLNECDVSGAVVASLSALYILHLSDDKSRPSISPLLTELLRLSTTETGQSSMKPNIRKQLVDASLLIQV